LNVGWILAPKGLRLRNSGKSQKPRILFVIGSLDSGGTERQMTTLIGRLQGLGYDCGVFALQTDGALVSTLVVRGIPVYSGGLQRGDIRKAPWKLLWSEWELIRVIKGWRPDVLHAFLPLVTFMGTVAGRLCRVPLVITSRRGLARHQERFVILKPLDLVANKLSHQITANSRAVWQDTVKRDHVDPSKIALIYNGVDSSLFESTGPRRARMRKAFGLNDQEKVVIMVANFIAYKGHADLLQAAYLVLKQIPSAVFLLVGEDRGIEEELKKQALSLGILERVRFMGQRNDIPQLMAASDVSVLASHEEGFSNVILESMAAGLPVIVTDVGGNREAVLDGATGWLVPEKNPREMAQKLVDLLQDPERAKSWGEIGRNRVKELFTIDKMVQGHTDLYAWNKAHRTIEQDRAV
jgi:glycosyltransferase involved in cell wall biosynthesis